MRQRGFQPAQSLAQAGQHVFGFGRSGVVDQQKAAPRIENRLRAAAAGEGARQQVVGDLFFQFLLFLAADAARFVVLDFGHFLVQNVADHARRQHFFLFFQGHTPSVIGEAFAEPVQTLAMGKRRIAEFLRERFQIGQLVFVQRIKTDLLKPHGLYSLSSNRRIIQQARRLSASGTGQLAPQGAGRLKSTRRRRA